MRRDFIAAAVAVLTLTVTALGQNLLTNGDWETGDETGWTQTPKTSWGNNTETWVVASPNAPTPADDDYSGQLGVDLGSFGWYQVVEVPTSYEATVEADWKGASISWAEVMLFTFDHDPTDAEVNDVFGPGPVAAIAYKKDRWDINLPATWDWEAASLSPHPDPNSNHGTVVSEGWVVVGLKLGSNENNIQASVFFDNVVLTAEPGPCLVQHELTSISPDTIPDDQDVLVTIYGTDLQEIDLADGAIKLVPIDGGNEIPGTGATLTMDTATDDEVTVNFATTGEYVGRYTLRTTQALPCAGRQLISAFTITCSNESVVTGMTPDSVTDPVAGVVIRIDGPNVAALDAASIRLELGTIATVGATNVSSNGPDQIEAMFNLSCSPAGLYTLKASRTNGCADLTPASAGDDRFRLSKTPAATCIWQPWAASWSNLNLGPDLDPPHEVYNPTNWDFSMSQATGLGMTLDTPDASARALHWFIGSQAPVFPDTAAGSGGVFQQLTGLTPGAPLEYSVWWKMETNADVAWLELILIDGPFSAWDADAYQEQTEGANNPAIVRKVELSTASPALGWTEVTHLDQADAGPYGPRPTTITPTGTVATVVLKAGRYPRGEMEALFDNVFVTQNGGANLIANGDFENGGQVVECEYLAVAQDACEQNQYRETDFLVQPPCHDPFADFDNDGDVDHDDAGAFQKCFTGSVPNSVRPECLCFDRPEPTQSDGDVDVTDALAFEACASGPGIPADPGCDD